MVQNHSQTKNGEQNMDHPTNASLLISQGNFIEALDEEELEGSDEDPSPHIVTIVNGSYELYIEKFRGQGKGKNKEKSIHEQPLRRSMV